MELFILSEIIKYKLKFRTYEIIKIIYNEAKKYYNNKDKQETNKGNKK